MKDLDSTLLKMETYGGSFIKGLVSLYRKGDPDNKTILYNSFKHYFEKYEKM